MAQEDDRRVQEIVVELQGATLGGHALVAVLPKLRRLLEAEKVAAYKPVRAGNGFRLEFAFFEGFAPDAERLLQGWALTAPADAFLFDPELPAVEQRNVVLRTRSAFSPEDIARVPIVQQLFPKMGLTGLDMIRVLVCEGPKLLAWVGAWRARSFTELDEQRFTLLVPALQSRLDLEATLYR
jgi:hypothetical protein